MKNLFTNLSKTLTLSLFLFLGIGNAWGGGLCGFCDKAEVKDENVYIKYSKDGGSATQQYLYINGQSDIDLGTVTSLNISEFRAITKKHDGNVCAVRLYYLVDESREAEIGSTNYESATYDNYLYPDWTWDNWWKCEQYKNPSVGLNILNALTPGDYYFNFYFSIYGNENSNSGCWEHQAYWSNNGGNYHMSFTVPSKSLTVAGAANGNTVSGDQTDIASGTAYTITATAAPGYKFNGWTATSGSSSITITDATSAETTVTFNDYANDATVTASFVRTYAFVQGRFHVTDAARSGSWTNTFEDNDDDKWDVNSTKIPFAYDGTNHEFYCHTYATPYELSAQIASNNPWFSVATSTESNSMSNKTSFNTSEDTSLSDKGSANGVSLATGNSYSVKFNSSDDENGYAILYFDESKVWYELECALTYNGNGSDGGSAPASRAYYAYGSNQAAANNTFEKDGSTFYCWNTKADGTGTSYFPGQNVPMNTKEIALYAQWATLVNLPATLDKDNYAAYGGGIGMSGSESEYFDYSSGTTTGYVDWKVNISEACIYTVTINGDYPNGHRWQLSLINGDTTCTFNKTYTEGSYPETKLWNLSGISTGEYVIRIKNILNNGYPKLLSIAMDPITVTYDANGGTCATASAVYAGTPLALPTPDSRSGYIFEGWYNGNAKAANPYTPDASVTLTARWGKILNMPNTFTKDNVATYCDEMTWYGSSDEYFDFGPTDAPNLGRWARWEVSVVPCKYTISWVSDYTSSSAINWGLILFDGADTVATYFPAATTWSKKEYTDPTQWDLTKNKKTKGDLAAGTYTLEIKNMQSYAQPKLKSLTLAADEYTITYSAGTYGSGSLASGTKIACQDYTLSSADDAFSRYYYTYDGWSTSPDGSTDDYDFGETYSTEADLALYPHWELDCGTLYAPSALAASDILDVSATLTITDDYDAPSYEIYYSTSSTAPTPGTTATTTSTSKTKTITGLTASTTYYAWVRAVCDGSNKTDWVAITDESFSTVATVYAVTIGTVTTNQYKSETPATGGTISASASTAAAGATVTLTATPVSGFGFVRWQIVNEEEEDVTSTVLDGNTLTMPAYNVTVNATFATRYTILYKEADRTTTVTGMEPTYYLYGVGVPSLPTPEKTGYRFDGWYMEWCTVVKHETEWAAGIWNSECITTGLSSSDHGGVTYLAHWIAVEDIAEGCWDNGEYKCGDVPNFNTPNPDGTGDWGTASNWGGGKAPDEDTYVVLPNSITIAAGDVAIANTIVLEDNADLTIADGGALIVENGIEQGSGSDITLGSSIANGNATLIYDISEGLNATVKMASKATTTGSDWTWQYIGVPVVGTGIHAEDMYHGGYLYKWINGTGWSAVAAKDNLEAFAGYCVSYPNADGHTFTMSGELTEIEETSIPVAAGTAQVIGNSWTAPIQIAQMEASDFNQVDQTIYLFNTGSDVDGTGSEAGSSDRYAPGTYVTVPIAEALSIGVTKVSALQGFFVKNETNTNGYITLRYSKHVRPTSGGSNVINGPMHAPKRIIAEQEDQAAVAILTVSGTRYDDQLFLIERDNCTDGYDAGHDGEKIGSSSVSPWIYALRADGTHDAVSATDDLEGAVIGFRAGEDTEYTIHFDYSDEAEELYLYDTETNTYTQVLTDNTYTFTTSDKEEHARFTLLRANAPQIATGMENAQSDDVQCTKARKLMLDGQLYLMYKGTMYNVQGAKVK